MGQPVSSKRATSDLNKSAVTSGWSHCRTIAASVSGGSGASPTCTEVLSPSAQRQFIMDCTGHAPVVSQWIDLVAPGGTYSIPGIATPQEAISLELFGTIARKNVRLQGVWVSDTSHLWGAVQLVAAGRYPFEKLITHAFPLEQATRALEVTESKEAVKAILLP